MSRIRLMVFIVALLFVFPVAAFALSPGDRVTYVTGTTARSGTLLVQTSTLDLVARAGTVSTQDQVVPSVVHPVATPTPTPSPTPTPTPSPSPSPTPSPTPTPTPTRPLEQLHAGSELVRLPGYRDDRHPGRPYAHADLGGGEAHNGRHGLRRIAR
jgi:hypothetical protein